jgi:hypothetical protein
LHALNINDKTVNETLPSLYLNIENVMKIYMILRMRKKYYRLAFSVTDHLPDNRYSNMIKAGIDNALKR